MIHTRSLENFYNNIKSLVKASKINGKLLASCGEIESSILANMFRVREKSPRSEFNNIIGRFQDKYDDITHIDLDDFMRRIVMESETLVKYGQRATKSEKDVEILALTSQIQELKILLSEQLTDQGGLINPTTIPTSY